MEGNKKILTSMTFPAVEVFYPALYAELDTGGQRKPRFRNTELLVPGMRGGKGIVDLLVDLPMKGGDSTPLLLHGEVQGRGGRQAFNVRMYYYSCLVALRMRRPFVALAIRTTPKKKGEETAYDFRRFETRSLYEYRTVYVDALDEATLLLAEYDAQPRGACDGSAEAHAGGEAE